MNAFRLPGLAVVLGLIVGALIIDQSRPPADVVEIEADLPATSVRPADALSSTWFCTAATAAGGNADSEVVLSNPEPSAAVATLSVFTGSSEPVNDLPVTELTMEIPAQSTINLRPAELVAEAEVVSVAVEVDAGGVIVDKVSSGVTGVARTACADDGSTEWVLTSGSTVPGANLQLVIFNPFPDFATVDVDFLADGSRRSPEDLIALPIPARSSRLIDVGEGVASAENITSFVRVRSGRVIAETVQSFDGTGASPLGLSVLTGAPQPAQEWTFAGITPAAGPARLVIVNPSETRVRATVDVFASAAERFVEPFDVVLQPGQGDVIELVSSGRLADISSFSLVVRSLDGPFIIAGMEQRPDIVEPDPLAELVELDVDAPTTGFASSIGQPLTSTTAVTTVDLVEGDERSAIHIFNPADDTFVQVEASIIADGASRAVPLEVGPLRTLRVPLAELGSGRFTLRLDASGPIVASREVTGLSARSWAPFVPGADGVPES